MPSVTELIDLAKSGQPDAAAAMEMLNGHRRALAKSFLASPPDDGALEPRVIEIIDLAGGALPLELTPEDRALLDAILEGWAEGETRPSNVLMAAIALAPAHYFPLPAKLSVVPVWLRSCYVKFLIAQPPIFTEPGEADRYADHGAATMALLHAAIVVDHMPDAEALADVIVNVNSTMMYFNERPLRRYFKQRSQIVEWLMLARGYRLGWSFPFEPGRPARIGIYHRSMEPGTETFHLLAHLAGRGRDARHVILYVPQTAPPGLVEAFRPWVTEFVPLPNEIPPAVTRMRRDELDVCFLPNNLVCTFNLETGVAMHRLARVQVVSGASPASPGILAADIFLSSPTNDPSPSAQDEYEEKLAYLPGAVGHFSYSYDTEPRTVSCSRASIGLPDSEVVFFSGANYYKLTPEMIAVWAEILSRAPQSRLLLMPFNPHWANGYPVMLFSRRLNRQLADAGVAPSRVKIVEKVPTRADLHAVMALADIYLDSFPYSGACSLVDPLTVGLPIVSRAGHTLRTAQGAGVLAAEGLEGAVCANAGAYIERAVSLATDPGLLAREKDFVRRIVKSSPACTHTEVFARGFSQFCAEAHGAYARHYAQMRTGAADDARAAVLKAVALAKQEPAPVFQHLYSIDVVARLLVPYLTTLVREGQAAGRVFDLGSGDGDIAGPFLRGRFRTELFEPDPERAAAIGDYVARSPKSALHRSFALASETPPPTKSAKKARAAQGRAPSPMLRDCLAGDVEVVRMDAERIGFDVGEGLALLPETVRAVMIDLAAQPSGRSRKTLVAAADQMRAKGYDTVVLTYRDLSPLGLTNWDRELTGVVFDAGEASGDGPFVALFHKKDDVTFLAYLAQLFEACAPAQARPWSNGAPFVERAGDVRVRRASDSPIPA